jgi:hypothetical protein
VQHVSADAAERALGKDVLESPQRQPESRAPANARRQGVERIVERVTLRCRCVAEAKS